VSALYTSLGLDFWRKDPARAVSLFLAKVYYLANGHEIPNNRDLYYERRHSVVLTGLLWHAGIVHFPFGVVFPLAVYGCWVRRRHSAWPLYVYVAGYSASVVLFFVTERYRLPLVPAILVFAGAGAFDLWRRRKVTARHAGLLLGAFLVANSHWGRAGTTNPSQEEMRLGEAYLESGNARKATEAFRRASLLDPSSPEAWGRLGASLQAVGDRAGATEALEAAALRGSKDPLAWFNLGTAYLEAGRLDPARGAFEKATVLDPRHLDSWINLGIARSGLGLVNDARSALEQALILDPRNVTALVERGRVLAAMGDASGAEQDWLAAAHLDPRSLEAHMNLSLLAYDEGRLDEAEKELGIALSINPGFGLIHFHLARIAARRGNQEAMMRHLNRAREGGAPLDQLLADPAFNGFAPTVRDAFR
jgi:tetratricopeptide (TPR) repeat protein